MVSSLKQRKGNSKKVNQKSKSKQSRRRTSKKGSNKKSKSCLPIKNIEEYKKDYIVLDNLEEYRDILPYSEKTKKNIIDKLKIGLRYKEKGSKTEDCIVNIGIRKNPKLSKIVGYLDENNPYDMLYDKEKLRNKKIGDKVKHKGKTYTIVPDIIISSKSIKYKNDFGSMEEPLSLFVHSNK